MKKQQALNSLEAVKEKALRLLEFRSHSESELRDKLRRGGASDEHIDETLDFCRRYGLVNDAEYARAKARDLAALKKLGRRRIELELKQKGISSEDIENAMITLEDADESDTLRPLVKKKLGGDFSRKNIDKCIRYFMYRGYELCDIKDCVRELEEYEEFDES